MIKPFADAALAALAVAALDGVSCVATFGLQVRLAATAAYVLPMLLPLSLGLAMRSDDIAHFTALGQLLLAGWTALVAVQIWRSRLLPKGLALFGAAAVLAAHGQIDLVASWQGSAGLFWIVIGAACVMTIAGFGIQGYALAMRGLRDRG